MAFFNLHIARVMIQKWNVLITPLTFEIEFQNKYWQIILFLAMKFKNFNTILIRKKGQILHSYLLSLISILSGKYLKIHGHTTIITYSVNNETLVTLIWNTHQIMVIFLLNAHKSLNFSHSLHISLHNDSM